MTQLSKEIVDIILNELQGRCGFDGVFDSLDEVTGGELRDTLKSLVLTRLEEEMK